MSKNTLKRQFMTPIFRLILKNASHRANVNEFQSKHSIKTVP